MNDLELRSLYQRLVELRSDGSRRSCVSPDNLIALAEGALAEEDRLRLLGHVAVCSYCQRDLSLARAVSGTTAPGSARRLSRWAVPAAAAAALLVAVVLVRGWSDGPDVMRSDGTALSIVRPSGVTPGTDSTFVWHAAGRARIYRVEVMTAGGSLVQTGESTDTTFALPRRLQPGEYFWRVTASLDDGSTRSSPAVRFEVRRRP